MIGAVIGDITGSYWEFRNQKDRNSPLFLPESTITDDSVLTIATADAILTGQNYTDMYQKYCRLHHTYGYGPSFMEWAHTSTNYIKPNYSWGNGSAMRVSPIGWAFSEFKETLIEAQQSAGVSHAHSSGIQGAQSVAIAIFMIRNGAPIDAVEEFIGEYFGYETRLDLDVLNREYTFDVSCQGTMPAALSCLFQSSSFEDALRNGLHVGGDCDTICAIIGGIAEVRFGVPNDLRLKAEEMLGNHSQRWLGILRDFERKYGYATEPSSSGLFRSGQILKAMKSLAKQIRRA